MKISNKGILRTFEGVIYDIITGKHHKETNYTLRDYLWQALIGLILLALLSGIVISYYYFNKSNLTESVELTKDEAINKVSWIGSIYNLNTNFPSCKYGCCKNNKPCKDTRSILAIDEFDDININCEKTNGYTCPIDKKESWLFSKICQPTTCKANPSINHESLEASKDFCKNKYNQNKQCPTPQCKLYEADDKHCPFPPGEGPMGRKSYSPLEVLRYADPSELRALPSDKEIQWENKVRYEIVTQNYIPDLYK